MGKGRPYYLEYACCSNGKKPANDFLDDLDDKIKMKFFAVLQQLVETGKLWNKEKFKKLSGGSGLWELRVGDYRLLCFKLGRAWVLTNGFKKSTNKTRPQLIEFGERVMGEHRKSCEK